MNNNKLRLSYLKKCCEMSPFIRVQDLEDKIYNKKHQLLKLVFEKKQHYKLLQHNILLLYPIENDNLTEFRIDLDNINLLSNLETMFKIKSKLDNLNIKAVYEFTGSKGFHVRFLINVTNQPLKYKYSNVDLKSYELEFRAKDKSQPNYKTISMIAKERLEFKKQLSKYIGLFNIIPLNDFDTNLLSSFYLLGCVGSKHRKTFKYKLSLDLNKLKTASNTLNFIESNPITYIDFSFLNNVWIIPNDFKFKVSTQQTKFKTKTSRPYTISNINPTEHTQEKRLLKTLYTLYNNSDCQSINRFSLYVINLLYSFKFNLQEIKSLHNKLLCLIHSNIDIYNLSDEYIYSKYNFIVDNYNISLVSYKFKDFWTQNQFMTTFKEVLV